MFLLCLHYKLGFSQALVPLNYSRQSEEETNKLRIIKHVRRLEGYRLSNGLNHYFGTLWKHSFIKDAHNLSFTFFFIVLF